MCGATAADTATTCVSCGAAVATRDSLGGLVIPGVTAVDPALAAYDAQPWHLPKSSPSQGMAGGTVAAAAAFGGPAGLVALAGLAAVAATEYAGASRGTAGGAPALEDVGRPMESALKMLERLQREESERGSEGGVETEREVPPGS